MAVSNFLLTLLGVGAVAYMMRVDVRQSSSMFRRNLKHIRSWLEEQGAEKVVKEEIKQVGESSSKHVPPPPKGGE